MTTNDKGSLAAALRKTGAGGRTAGKQATLMAAEAQVQSGAKLRNEGDIQGNPLYVLLNSAGTLDHTEIVERLGKMLSRDPELSKEENQARIHGFEELNRYYQDQMVAMAQKLTAFSHDEALSLYDETVEGIKHKLVAFKSDIEPMVRALQVIKDAETAGEDPHAMIEAVQDMHRKRAELEAELEELAVKKAENDREKGDLSDRSTQLTGQISQAGLDKKDAEGVKTEKETELAGMQGKILGSWRFKDEIAELDNEIARKIRAIERYDYTISSSTSELTDVAEKLKEKEEAGTEMSTRQTAAREELTALQASMQGDANTMALSKLLEITGKEYKGKRDGLVDNAKSFIEDAIVQFNQCIGRFSSLEGDISSFSRSAQNIINMQFLLISGAEKAYRITDEQLKADEAEKARLDEVEKDLDFNSAGKEKAITEIKDGKEFLNAFLPTRDSVINFRQILASREAEFTALSGLVQGKRMDAEELRTNGAVAVASQLVMTLKSLEAAVAGQKTDMLRNMLTEFTTSARQATDQVLGGLVSDQKGRNVRLDEAITGLVDMRATIDKFSDDLLSERVTGAGLTEAIIEATNRVVQSTEDLANTVTDGRRDAKDQVGKVEAAGIVDSYEQTLAPPERKLG